MLVKMVIIITKFFYQVAVWPMKRGSICNPAWSIIENISRKDRQDADGKVKAAEYINRLC